MECAVRHKGRAAYVFHHRTIMSCRALMHRRAGVQSPVASMVFSSEEWRQAKGAPKGSWLMEMTSLLSRMLRCEAVRFLTSLPMIRGAAKIAHAPICSAPCASVIPCESRVSNLKGLYHKPATQLTSARKQNNPVDQGFL